MRIYNQLDHFIGLADQALKTITVPTAASCEPYSDAAKAQFSDDALTPQEKKLSARLMRVNHAGEIAAQGLYHGHESVARQERVAEQMKQAAHEESDHLAWCRQRTEELGGHVSLLSPFWYLGSFAVGAAAGLFGDRASLSFVQETEEQVVRHLDSHLQRISPRDKKTIAIIKRIKADEAEHADKAGHLSGGKQLSEPVKQMMRLSAKVMTSVSHYL